MYKVHNKIKWLVRCLEVSSHLQGGRSLLQTPAVGKISLKCNVSNLKIVNQYRWVGFSNYPRYGSMLCVVETEAYLTMETLAWADSKRAFVQYRPSGAVYTPFVSTPSNGGVIVQICET